jgi:hypothetical protein
VGGEVIPDQDDRPAELLVGLPDAGVWAVWGDRAGIASDQRWVITFARVRSKAATVQVVLEV